MSVVLCAKLYRSGRRCLVPAKVCLDDLASCDRHRDELLTERLKVGRYRTPVVVTALNP